MGVSLHVIDGQVFSDPDDPTTRLDATSSFESLVQNNIDDFYEAGRAKIGFSLTLDALGIPVLHIGIDTSEGIFDAAQLDSTVTDYFIVDKSWFHFPVEESIKFVEFCTLHGLSHGLPITTKHYFDILRFTNQETSWLKSTSEVTSKIKYQFREISDFESDLPLYPYQLVGAKWLDVLLTNEIGALLCDDMGLGKTIQAIAVLSKFASNENKVLILSPASLTQNWMNEIQKFAPAISPYHHVGNNRKRHPSEFAQENVVITSYETAKNDLQLLRKFEWRLVICDEAQALKNVSSNRRIMVDSLKSKSKILLSGTPVENSLNELWSLVDLAFPGILGDFKDFTQLADNQMAFAAELSGLVAPLILRRIAKEVLYDLPEIVQTDEALIPSSRFIDFYVQTLNNAKVSGLSASSCLMTLRQACCYPQIVDPAYSDPQDVKIRRTFELFSEISFNKEKLLIFSNFTKSIDLLLRVLSKKFPNAFVDYIDGRIPGADRYSKIEEFTNFDGSAVLILNPVAAGTGLNITAANHVIHFDRQWNPKLELQSSKRAHRNGQLKTVFVHKFYYLGTVEEVINRRHTEKTEVSEAALDKSESEGNDKDIALALRMSPNPYKTEE